MRSFCNTFYYLDPSYLLTCLKRWSWCRIRCFWWVRASILKKNPKCEFTNFVTAISIWFLCLCQKLTSAVLQTPESLLKLYFNSLQIPQESLKPFLFSLAHYWSQYQTPATAPGIIFGTGGTLSICLHEIGLLIWDIIWQQDNVFRYFYMQPLAMSWDNLH